MSRSRNAEDFLNGLLEANRKFHGENLPRIKAIHKNWVGSKKLTEKRAGLLLEFQTREYLINSLLKGLNWNLHTASYDERQNLIPEAQIQSYVSGNTLFLDYLGVASNKKPILILEAKRLGSPLPEIAEPDQSSPTLGITTKSLGEIVAQGLKGRRLTGGWNDWLEKLQEYYRSVTSQHENCTVRRIVITDGQWLVVFKDPLDSFAEHGSRSSANISAFQNRAAIEFEYREVFRLLEHQEVLEELPSLHPEEIGFMASGPEITRVLHGIKLKYQACADFLGISPRLNILPVLFLKTMTGAWLTVKSTREVQLPHESKDLEPHINEVREIAEDLLQNVARTLGVALAPSSIEAHFDDPDGFSSLKAFKMFNPDSQIAHDEAVIVTGDQYHFISPLPTVPNCQFHQISRHNARRDQYTKPILARSVNPRAFFVDGEPQHCNHAAVEALKASKLSDSNRERCGQRSGEQFDAFCEIWRLETRLCCRVCSFESVCTKAPVFALPCKKGSS